MISAGCPIFKLKTSGPSHTNKIYFNTEAEHGTSDTILRAAQLQFFGSKLNQHGSHEVCPPGCGAGEEREEVEKKS